LAPVTHGRWKKTALVAGMRCGGITAPASATASINGERFRVYIADVDDHGHFDGCADRSGHSPMIFFRTWVGHRCGGAVVGSAAMSYVIDLFREFGCGERI
jgi:hypothetical protein